MWIDSHCHLADEVFAADLEAVVARAKEAGLERVMVILEAGNQKEAAQAEHLERLWPETRFAIGVHPHQAHQFASDPARTGAVVQDQLESTPGARAVTVMPCSPHSAASAFVKFTTAPVLVL